MCAIEFFDSEAQLLRAGEKNEVVEEVKEVENELEEESGFEDEYFERLLTEVVLKYERMSQTGVRAWEPCFTDAHDNKCHFGQRQYEQSEEIYELKGQGDAVGYFYCKWHNQYYEK